MSLSLLLLTALGETIYMVFLSGLCAMLIGIPAGVYLYITRPSGLCENKIVYLLLNSLVDIFRSIPFIILIVFVIPVTRLLVGTSIGTNAAIVPLTIGAAPYVARLIANSLFDLDVGLIEAGRAMGASTKQIIVRILLPEALPSIVNGMTLMLVTLVGYSAMAGAVGAGGLGEVAIDYGYQRFDTTIMLSTVVILVLLVQLLQKLGDYFVRKLSH